MSDFKWRALLLVIILMRECFLSSMTYTVSVVRIV
jgi:hypothetical protein